MQRERSEAPAHIVYGMTPIPQGSGRGLRALAIVAVVATIALASMAGSRAQEGAVAVEGGKWELYLGGAAGSNVRKGDLLCTVDTHAEVLTYMGRFIQYYRENAKYLERSYGFVERLGIERLRQVLVEDSLGICGRLDAEIEAAVAAYTDPWTEAVKPVHASQFAAPREVTLTPQEAV